MQVHVTIYSYLQGFMYNLDGPPGMLDERKNVAGPQDGRSKGRRRGKVVECRPLELTSTSLRVLGGGRSELRPRSPASWFFWSVVDSPRRWIG